MSKRKQETTDAAQAKKPRSTPSTTYRTNPEFLVALIHTRVEQLKLPENKVFVAERNDKIIDVFKGLVKHNFLSVPVLQASGHKYWGFVDISDILHFILKTFGQHKLGGQSNFWEMAQTEDELTKKTVNDVMQYPSVRSNMFHPVKGGYSLYYAIEALAKERELHRLAVVDEERMIMNIVTQSQLVDFLNKNYDLIGSKTEKPIGNISRVFRDVYSINVDEEAFKAFEMMVEKKVSGLAVVDSHGKLVGNISNRDLKGISADGSMFWRMFQKVHNFLDKVNKEDPEHKRPSRNAISINSTNTIGQVIKLLAENSIHRVFIVDDNEKPVGVVSLRDILLEIITD